MIIDCDTCRMRALACDDCVVTVLLGEPGADRSFDEEETRAIEVLAESGLVPPLRLDHGDTPVGHGNRPVGHGDRPVGHGETPARAMPRRTA